MIWTFPERSEPAEWCWLKRRYGSMVWFDLFAGRQSPPVDALEVLIHDKDDLCVCGVILTEVLQGIRRERQYRTIRERFDSLVFLPMHPWNDVFGWYNTFTFFVYTRNYNSFFCYLLGLCIVVRTFFVETWGLPSYRLYTLLLGTRGFSYI